MDSPSNLRPLLASQQSERESLCETLARVWIPLQVDSNDDYGKEKAYEAELSTDWNPKLNQCDTPDRKTAGHSNEK
jgi:hypothetical protein